MTIASVTEAVSSVVGRHMLSARFAMQSRKTSTSSDEHRTGKHLTETMNPSTTSGVPNKETRHPSSHRSRAVRCPASHRYANGHRQKQRRHAVERPERWCSMQQSPFASLKTGSVDASLKKRSIRHPGSCPERWQKPGRRTAWVQEMPIDELASGVLGQWRSFRRSFSCGRRRYGIEQASAPYRPLS